MVLRDASASKKDIKRPFFPPCKNWPICKSIQILRILCMQSNQEIPDPQPPLGKIWDVMSQKRHHRNEMWQLCDVVCIKCKETFLGKDTFQISYRCRGGGGGAMRGTLILFSPDTMEHSLLWRGNCRQGSKKLQHWWKSWNNKNSGKWRVEVWTYSPYVAAEVSASGTRLDANWQLFQIAIFLAPQVL